MEIDFVRLSDHAQVSAFVEELGRSDPSARVVVLTAPPPEAQAPVRDLVAVDSPRGNARRLIERRAVLYGKALGDYVRLVTDEGRFLVRGKISDMEQRWGPKGFVRTHRGFVINSQRAVEIRRSANGTAMVHFDDGDRVPVSRRQLTAVKAALNA